MKNENQVLEAAKLFIANGFASVQLICRRLNLSYNEAAEIMETLEQNGIVGPFSGTKNREVLIKNQDAVYKILSKK